MSNRNYWKRWSRSRDQSTGPYYRQGPRFVQHGVEPKELDQKKLNRRAWREQKQLERDKKRTGSIQDGCPPWLKRICNKVHRRWEHDSIKKGQFEVLGSRKRKDIFDPWKWD